jgi:hypothetical protein
VIRWFRCRKMNQPYVKRRTQGNDRVPSRSHTQWHRSGKFSTNARELAQTARTTFRRQHDVPVGQYGHRRSWRFFGKKFKLLSSSIIKVWITH